MQNAIFGKHVQKVPKIASFVLFFGADILAQTSFFFTVLGERRKIILFNLKKSTKFSKSF